MSCLGEKEIFFDRVSPSSSLIFTSIAFLIHAVFRGEADFFRSCASDIFPLFTSITFLIHIVFRGEEDFLFIHFDSCKNGVVRTTLFIFMHFVSCKNWVVRAPLHVFVPLGGHDRPRFSPPPPLSGFTGRDTRPDGWLSPGGSATVV